MRQIELDKSWFEGAVEIEKGDGYLKPWRLPCSRRHLFPSPNDGLFNAAEHCSGVRLRFLTDSSSLTLHFQPLPPLERPETSHLYIFDLTIDGELVASKGVGAGGESVTFEQLPEGEKIVELWLPQHVGMKVTGLETAGKADARAVDDVRPRWITYGSSLTHCVRAHGPSRIWPAIVARRHGLNLTSLGYGGQCHLDPLVAMMIRDMPADYITLKVGINTVSGSLSARTFPAAVMGLVQIIREKHEQTPVGLVSPIGYPPHETTPNRVDYTIGAMREAIADVQVRLRKAGDRHLLYTNGLKVFSLDEIATYTLDQCHPNGDGILLMADNFDREVMTPLLEAFPRER